MTACAPVMAWQVFDKPQGRKPRVVQVGRCNEYGLWGFVDCRRATCVITWRLVKLSGPAFGRWAGNRVEFAVHVPEACAGFVDLWGGSAKRHPIWRQRPALFTFVAAMIIMGLRVVVTVAGVAGLFARRSR